MSLFPCVVQLSSKRSRVNELVVSSCRVSYAETLLGQFITENVACDLHTWFGCTCAVQ